MQKMIDDPLKRLGPPTIKLRSRMHRRDGTTWLHLNRPFGASVRFASCFVGGLAVFEAAKPVKETSR